MQWGLLEAILSWGARLLGLVGAGFFFVFAFGNQLNLAKLTRTELPMMLALIAACLGMILLWRWQAIGGAIVVLGMATFYGFHFLHAGRWWAGPFFLLFFAPGVLALLGSSLRSLVTR